MKKTLALSMMLCGSLSLVLAGCGTKDDGTDGSSGANTAAENADTNEEGDGDPNETGGDENMTGDGDGDGDGGDGDDPGLTFVPNNDLVSVSECDPFAQDCPEGEKCVPYGSTGGNWDANKCVTVTGSGVAGDPCTYGGTAEATDDCDENSHCWDVMDVDGMNVGVCTEFCGGSADDPICAPGTSCLIANEGSITLCIQSCDPLLQECAAGLACWWAGSDFQCIFTTQEIPLGEPCGFINDCEVGTGCLNAEIMPNCNGSACCGSFCDLADPVCPQMGTECAAFFEDGMAPPGLEDVGVCILPGA